ncbi:MAG: AbrB/MazE/SpoVT family DNA-binding domain-containing protein [Nanoarchaeota archaeon]
MRIKSIKISEKGQIAIPIDVRRELGLEKGDELILSQQGNRIIIEKNSRFAEDAELKSLFSASLKTAEELWDNKEDDVWNDV